MTAHASISEQAISEDSSTISTPSAPTILLARKPVFIAGQNLYRADLGSTFDGSPIVAEVERVGWTIEGTNRDGSPRNNPSRVKLLREMWPIIRGTSGDTINFYFAGQMRPEDPLAWQGPYPFVIGTNMSVQPLVEGAYLSMKAISNGQSEWSLLAVELDIEPTGEVLN